MCLAPIPRQTNAEGCRSARRGRRAEIAGEVPRTRQRSAAVRVGRFGVHTYAGAPSPLRAPATAPTPTAPPIPPVSIVRGSASRRRHTAASVSRRGGVRGEMEGFFNVEGITPTNNRRITSIIEGFSVAFRNITHDCCHFSQDSRKSNADFDPRQGRQSVSRRTIVPAQTNPAAIEGAPTWDAGCGVESPRSRRGRRRSVGSG